MKQHSVDVHDEKKAQISKKKKSKKKNKHLKDKNVAEVEEDRNNPQTGFAQKNLLEQHKNAVHEEKKAFKCSLCDGRW